MTRLWPIRRRETDENEPGATTMAPLGLGAVIGLGAIIAKAAEIKDKKNDEKFSFTASSLNHPFISTTEFYHGKEGKKGPHARHLIRNFS